MHEYEKLIEHYRTIKVASGVWVCLGAENEFLIVKLFVKAQDNSRE